LEKASRELEMTLQSLQSRPSVTTAQPNAIRTPSSFDAHKGLLNWPVRGKIVTSFGQSRDEKYDVTTFQSGINIQAARGEPVHAVSEGDTIYSGWFKSFGNMLIVDHGDHYYTVYAHLEEVFKVKGDRVEKDEVIATLGDSGSLIGPALHFEVRHHGKPVDPLQWIKKG
jgi:septal ring factor EnvC (AmiA/AmiB activator)